MESTFRDKLIANKGRGACWCYDRYCYLYHGVTYQPFFFFSFLDDLNVCMLFESREDYNFCKSCALRLRTAITRLEDPEWPYETGYYPSSQPYNSPHELELELEALENQYTIPNLRYRATDGCRLCSLILGAFTKEEASLTDWLYIVRPSHGHITLDKSRHGTSGLLHESRQFELNFNWSFGREIEFDDEVKTKQVTIKVVEVKKLRRLEQIATNRSSLYDEWRAEPSRSTSSVASIDQVDKWIEECNSHGCYKV
jgi:hypothetical protein